MNDKVFFTFSIVFSIIVFGLVVALNYIPKPDWSPPFTPYQPALHALINGTCSVLLLLSFYHIRKKNVAMHKKLNMTAFFLSALFLVSYVTYHYFATETRFPKDNPLRPFYLVILLTHIIFAAGVLPFILISFYRGLNMQVEKHRKIARWTFPIWLYVTITGVLVYLMISPYQTH